MLCTLLVPDLLPPGPRDAQHPAPRAPRLAALLARGNSTALPAGGMEAWLCGQFGGARQHDWPVAPLTLAADGGETGDGYWLRCDPVHLHVRQNRMHLSNTAGAATPAETDAMIAALNRQFADDGLHFHAGADGRCYVRCDQHSDIVTHPLHAVIDRDINPYMPAGADSGYWRRVLNEIQMLLHAHPVNAEREARGQAALNSVWLWGGGRKPQTGSAPFTTVWSNDALANALAAAAALPGARVPDDAHAVTVTGGHPLVVLTAARDAGNDAAAWHRAIEQLERDWFAPCYSALRERRIQTLNIIGVGDNGGRLWSITTGNTWRWWRRPKTLSSHA
jgi:hypothetical protein